MARGWVEKKKTELSLNDQDSAIARFTLREKGEFIG
jgi:hypothetical protein